MTVRVLIGDVRDKLAELPDGSVHCCVTSPPYWGLRDYGMPGQIGLEQSPDEFLAALVEVFRGVRRVLRDDGTAWINMGDSYATGTTSDRSPTATGKHGYWENPAVNKRIDGREYGLKPKDLVGIPWMLAFALRTDGWYLRQDVIWAKPNPMPESVRDRCTKAHEYIFLLSKKERYHFDADAIKEPGSENSHGGGERTDERYHVKVHGDGAHKGLAKAFPAGADGRNKRSVWTVPTHGFPEAHFATFPPALIEPCILAGCPEGGTVLDPFGGAGTTGLVADRLGRNAILIELNPDYAAMAQRRIQNDSPLFAEVTP